MSRPKFTATVWGYSFPERSDELRHYASKYYDPIKAHEYYMRTRKLKGRKTGTSQTESERLKTELVERQEEKAAVAANEFNTKKAAIQRDIATLRAKYMGMNKEERARNKQSTRREIERLRKQIQQERLRIGTQLGIDLSALSDEYGNKIDALKALKNSTYRSNTKAGIKITPKEDRTKKDPYTLRDRLTPETSSRSAKQTSDNDSGFIKKYLDSNKRK